MTSIADIWKKKIENQTPLEYAIWRLPLGSSISIDAAEELASLHKRIAELEGERGCKHSPYIRNDEYWQGWYCPQCEGDA